MYFFALSTINSSFSDSFLLSFLIVADYFFATWLIVIRW